jgi:hypothetical protein
MNCFPIGNCRRLGAQAVDQNPIGPRWTSGRIRAVHSSKGSLRGTHRDPHQGRRGAAECQSWASSEEGQRWPLILVRKGLGPRRAEGKEGNGHSVARGSSWVPFIWWEGGEAAGRGRSMAHCKKHHALRITDQLSWWFYKNIIDWCNPLRFYIVIE